VRGRGEDRNAFDSLMNKARGHASSCTVVPLLDPMDAVFLSMKEINSLRGKASVNGNSVNPDIPKDGVWFDLAGPD
jgi:hypothetical protein